MDDPFVVARLLVAVGAYRSQHGVGPTWREAARAAGWTWRDDSGGVCTGYDSRELADRMRSLRRGGFITFTREPRSLDVTRAGRRWALETLSRDRGRTPEEARVIYRVSEVRGDCFAVTTTDGVPVAYAVSRIARDFARVLNMLEPNATQLEALLGEGRGRVMLRRLDGLNEPAPCHRCGSRMASGDPAWWNAHTRLVRHVGRCLGRKAST